MKPLVMIAMIGGCGTLPPADPELPKPPVGSFDCETACARGKSLGCPWSVDLPGPDGQMETTLDNVPCHVICENDEAAGNPQYNECVTLAASCDAQEACWRLDERQP